FIHHLATPAFYTLSLHDALPILLKSVILAAKEIIRKHLAASAGFIIFCPRPPNSCFTTRIANTPPSTAIHHAAPDGRFRASRRRSEEHTSELQSRFDLVCRLLLE